MEEVIWVSGETAHTCAACWAMSGRRFKIDEVPYDHPNGRCQLSPYLPELEEFNPEAYNHDTEAEFNRLTEDEQKNILGKTGFDLWKKGEAKLSDFAEIKDNDIWGRQIGLKSAESLKKKGIKTEKPTENSKAKKTEKIPEKEEKKTASELTNDNKKSYNISEDKKEFEDLHGKPLTEELSDKIKNNKYYRYNLTVKKVAQNVHLPNTKEYLDAIKREKKSVILSINGETDNDKILDLCEEILASTEKTIIKLTSYDKKNNKWCGKSIVRLKDFEIIYKDKKEKIRKTNTITIHTKQNGSAHIVPYKGELIE